MDDRQIRQRVDDLFRKNTTHKYTIEEIAHELGTGPTGLQVALTSAVRCPFTNCQSFDTAIAEKGKGCSEDHHCNRCDRNFLVEREPGGYAILGWYGE